MKILIIEDDVGLNRGISYALSQEGYETVTAFGQKSGTDFKRKVSWRDLEKMNKCFVGLL